MVLHTMDLFMEAEEVSLDVVLLPVVSNGQELQLAFPVNIDLPGMCLIISISITKLSFLQ